MKITNAGAGAGKTAKLADHILNRFNQLSCPHTHIFVIAYSNYAISVITNRIKQKHGSIPDNIHLSTIHSFLWNYIIKPYYFLLFKQQFTEISNQNIIDKPQYRAKKFYEMRNNGILHVQEFSRVSKKVLVKKAHDTKKVTKKRKHILYNLGEFIDSIFIDESQDMDMDSASCISALDASGIECFLVGDENQDLHSRGGFSFLIKKYFSQVCVDSENHRCPQTHVLLANRFSKVKQISTTGELGNIKYILETKCNVNQIVKEVGDSLVFINKSTHSLRVHKKNRENIKQLEYVIRKLHCQSPGFQDISSTPSKKWAFDVTRKIVDEVRKKQKSPSVITNNVINLMNLSYDKRKYAELIQSIKSISSHCKENLNFPLNSIESVKGNQCNECIFFISTDLFAYLIGEKTKSNATMNALYVGLTRSKNYLLLIFTKEVTEKYKVEFIEQKMRDLNIERF